MDTPSQNVTAFLEVLQDASRQLGQVWARYRQRGTQPNRPVLSLSRRENETARGVLGSITLALPVRGTDGRSYDLSVELRWNSERWSITTGAWVDTDAGQDLVRELPTYTATDLRTCMEQLRAAVDDLTKFEDLVAGKDGSS
jgi:hypothetical protein